MLKPYTATVSDGGYWNPNKAQLQAFFGTSGAPATVNAAFNAQQNEYADFLNRQTEDTNKILDIFNRGISTLTGLGNFDFQPYLNASRGAIQNATTRGVQGSLAAANAASGGRGLGGSFAAGMAQRAVQGAYGQQAAAEAELQRGLMDAQSRLNLGLMSALPSLYGGQAEVIANQVYPTTDFLGWYHTQQGQEMYDLMLQQLQQSINSPLNDPLNQILWSIITSLLPGSGMLGR